MYTTVHVHYRYHLQFSGLSNNVANFALQAHGPESEVALCARPGRVIPYQL